jgi:pantetheine-phosphate adenylyltransferase
MPATKLDPHHAVYLGSFDPVTLGHMDIISRGARVFDHLTVGIGTNLDKSPLFTQDERLALLTEVLRPLTNVTVKCFSGLAVNFARECGAAVMVRGVRTLTDIETEFTMTLANRALAPELETVFLMASEKYSHISSSLIKQVALLGNDATSEHLRSFLPPQVIGPVLAKRNLLR